MQTVGWRYKKIRDKQTGRLRSVTKDDIEYYKKPPVKLIKAFSNGDLNAKKMIYFEEGEKFDDGYSKIKIYDDSGETCGCKHEKKIVEKFKNGGTVSGKELKKQLKRNPEFHDEIGDVKIRRCFLKDEWIKID